MFFIAFAGEKDANSFLNICKIREQFLNHSSELIFDTFKHSFKTLREGTIYLNGFLNVVGGSQSVYFKVIERTQKEQDAYLKELLNLKANYNAYIKTLC